jgi:hypothetical protein
MKPLTPLMESSLLIREQCSRLAHWSTSMQKNEELDKLHRYTLGFLAHAEREKGGEVECTTRTSKASSSTCENSSYAGRMNQTCAG